MKIFFLKETKSFLFHFFEENNASLIKTRSIVLDIFSRKTKASGCIRLREKNINLQTLARKVKINHVRCFHVLLTPAQNFTAKLKNCLDQTFK
jgi:hypothetical protein